MIIALNRARPATPRGKARFSAKESVYKAVGPAAGTFTARLKVDGSRADGTAPLSPMSGRFLVGGGLIVTTVTVDPGHQ
jgi:4'-phosphopantetheinyl transferase EntD